MSWGLRFGFVFVLVVLYFSGFMVHKGPDPCNFLHFFG